LTNYFTNSSLKIKHRLSFKGLLSYDSKYFQAPLTTLDTCFLKEFTANHRFNLREEMLSNSLKLLEKGVIQHAEQSQISSLSYNLFYFKVHLGLDYFHPIFRDLRRMNSKISFFRRINFGYCRTDVSKGDYKKNQKF
jgi:hypothetical protein